MFKGVSSTSSAPASGHQQQQQQQQQHAFPSHHHDLDNTSSQHSAEQDSHPTSLVQNKPLDNHVAAEAHPAPINCTARSSIALDSYSLLSPYPTLYEEPETVGAGNSGDYQMSGALPVDLDGDGDGDGDGVQDGPFPFPMDW